MPLPQKKFKNFINNPNIQRYPLDLHLSGICCGTENRDAGICKKIVLLTRQFSN